jgi:hypothetical protein
VHVVVQWCGTGAGGGMCVRVEGAAPGVQDLACAIWASY